jgi:hypothetical protein
MSRASIYAFIVQHSPRMSPNARASSRCYYVVHVRAVLEKCLDYFINEGLGPVVLFFYFGLVTLTHFTVSLISGPSWELCIGA